MLCPLGFDHNPNSQGGFDYDPWLTLGLSPLKTHPAASIQSPLESCQAHMSMAYLETQLREDLRERGDGTISQESS